MPEICKAFTRTKEATNIIRRLKDIAAVIASALTVGGCASVNRAMLKHPLTMPAWTAWVSGDLETARFAGDSLTKATETCDAGYHILAFVAHVRGDHAAAITYQSRISPGYRWLAHLDEPILWSYVHSGDLRGATDFATRRRLSPATLAQLRLAESRPFAVELDGVVSLSFTDDKLSPFMPGFAATLCGRPAVVRLDTGGTFVHLSAAQAEAYGIETVASGQGFGHLTTHKVRFGVATEMTLGGAVLRNVPVVVHQDGAFPGEAIAGAFGVELGPIVGINVLQRFLTTVDGPGKRLILSRRGDNEGRREHLARLGQLSGEANEIPFGMWLDHYMIAPGQAAYRPMRFFVDSGIVAVDDAQQQVALLASWSVLASWGLAAAETSQAIVKVPGELRVGEASRAGATAFVVEDRVWRNFGDWGGSRVDALVSWGFLRHFVWTIDFDHMTYMLAAPADPKGAGGG